jgi:FAD binding domain
MNTGLQDAFNLGWKLALVCKGVSGPELLDSYEAERRPVAQRIVASGDLAEAGQALTAAGDRAARDVQIHHAYGDPDSAHHEAVAAAELDRCYDGSGAVVGDPSDRVGPGDRLPDALEVRDRAGAARCLHELTHRPGHTLLVVGGPEVEVSALRAVVDALEDAHAASPVIDAIYGLSPHATGDGLMRIAPAALERIGVDAITLLAARPDRYVGLRTDHGDAGAVADYLEALGVNSGSRR